MTTIAWVSIFAAPQLFVFSLVFERDHLAAIASAGGVVLLGETLTPLIALGGVTVIAGVAIIMVRRRIVKA